MSDSVIPPSSPSTTTHPPTINMTPARLSRTVLGELNVQSSSLQQRGTPSKKALSTDQKQSSRQSLQQLSLSEKDSGMDIEPPSSSNEPLQFTPQRNLLDKRLLDLSTPSRDRRLQPSTYTSPAVFPSSDLNLPPSTPMMNRQCMNSSFISLYSESFTL